MSNVTMRGFKKGSYLRRKLEFLAGEIQKIVPKAEISVSLGADSRRKHLFSMTVVAMGTGANLAMTKHGDKVSTVTSEMKRSFVHRLHEMKQKEIKRRVAA